MMRHPPIETAKQRAERRGLRAERLCLWLLRLKGYRILARRYRVPVGEIDILARRGRILVAVEVKARETKDLAALSLRPRQRKRIIRAVEHFQARHPRYGDCAVRFDVMLVAPRCWPQHLCNAWTQDWTPRH